MLLTQCGCADPEATFKKCARCRRALYCSQECQVYDWNVVGHRNVCRKVAVGEGERPFLPNLELALNAGAVPELGSTTAAYVAWLAGTDVRRHWRGLCALRESHARRRKVPEGQIGFKVSYRSSPPKLAVFDMAVFLAEKNANRDPWLADVVRSVLTCTDDGPRKKELLFIEYWWNGGQGRIVQTRRQGYFDMGAIDVENPGNVPCRPGCVGPDNRPMDCAWDEIDEIMRRLYATQREARCLGLRNAEERHVWDYLDASTGVQGVHWNAIERALETA